ncbi:putative selenium-dependent hydroxylase accessory protein YqeC [Alkaliphilus sp. MSJ-5]|uniref:Selenium-dependent hydroxylase accessory protein YqeC n=1 Tax=Alkaliphilus flagellatus TaxID=2841507 RepID=A0ABS6G129_9FIRM|nr:selenium cofactor biosynthesis protein YqeC [Alkaliphilus flagellatus]MBU5676190.1 putative selenium-dependent hydroxylase accessory protein YqeC [Alkaliphilus flagellatus]
MKLIEALGLKEPILITLIGGGGKTTTLFRLGEELSHSDESVMLTTTTAMFMPSSSTYDLSIITKSADEAKKRIKENLNIKRILLGKEITTENKLKGFTPEEMDEIYKENKGRWFLVEGDGSNGRSLKVPDIHEPQVPSTSGITIILIGTDILGKEINKENVHRHHLISELIQKCGSNVDKKLIIDLAVHPLGITKGIPNDSKKVILFNKVRSNTDSFLCLCKLSSEILQKSDNIKHILLGEVQDKDPILEVLGGKI